jgi:hypothetical protein
MYILNLALNKICFWHFITMSESTKRRWNSGPSTPSSTSKKKKYNCKFQDEFWTLPWDFLKISTLQEEFLEYQLTPEDELPSTESGIDTFWGLVMADHKEPFTDKLSFSFIQIG